MALGVSGDGHEWLLYQDWYQGMCSNWVELTTSLAPERAFVVGSGPSDSSRSAEAGSWCSEGFREQLQARGCMAGRFATFGFSGPAHSTGGRASGGR